MDRDSDGRGAAADHRRSAPEKPARHLRPRHQLVAGDAPMTPLQNPPQGLLLVLMLATGSAVHAEPARNVAVANAAARVQPDRAGYINAIQRFAYAEGSLYQVYTAPGQVTDIALEPGERLVGPGPVAAGDTARWIIGDTISGSGPTLRVHILVKPTRPDLATNLLINTDRRTYHIELRAMSSTYMASVAWTYPQDALIALARNSERDAATAPVAAGLDIERLNFGYRIDGKAPWRPLLAFDDGTQAFIAFPAGIAQGEMPPLFVIGANGKTAELVNYRVRGSHMIVDRLFDTAELRLGGKKQQRVRIVREQPR
ncbi:P-type conjugative transfer protein TrbG [Sandaracinobacteroides saxicola]